MAPDVTSGSRFGSAVENLGDIHNDGFEDFAVGAPYFGDDRAGAVFIYRGNHLTGKKFFSYLMLSEAALEKTFQGEAMFGMS